MAVGVSCTIGRDKEKYYFYRGRRISEEKAKTLRAGVKSRTAKCKRSAAAKAAAKRTSAARRASAEKRASAGKKMVVAKRKVGRPKKTQPKRVAVKEEEIVFIENPAFKKAAVAKSVKSATPKAKTPKAKSIPPAPPTGRAPSLLGTLPFFGASIPAGGRASNALSIGQPRQNDAPAKAQAAAPKAPSSAGARAKERIATRAAERVAVWQLVPYEVGFGIDKVVMLPNHRVDSITRRELLSSDIRKALYRKHNAAPGTLVWVNPKTDAALAEIEENRVSWDAARWRTFLTFLYPNIVDRLDVIRM